MFWEELSSRLPIPPWWSLPQKTDPHHGNAVSKVLDWHSLHKCRLIQSGCFPTTIPPTHKNRTALADIYYMVFQKANPVLYKIFFPMANRLYNERATFYPCYCKFPFPGFELSSAVLFSTNRLKIIGPNQAQPLILLGFSDLVLL